MKQCQNHFVGAYMIHYSIEVTFADTPEEYQPKDYEDGEEGEENEEAEAEEKEEEEEDSQSEAAEEREHAFTVELKSKTVCFLIFLIFIVQF